MRISIQFVNILGVCPRRNGDFAAKWAVADSLGLYQPGLIGDLGIVIMIINNINQLGIIIHYNYHKPRPGNPMESRF